jgi:hypothetical protein
VFAGTRGFRVLRSDDGGFSWQYSGLDQAIVTAITVSPGESETVYAGARPTKVFVSRNGGAVWSEVTRFRHIRSRWFWISPATPPFTACDQAIALSPADPQKMVVGIEAGAVVRSHDGGETWSDHRRGALRDYHSLAGSDGIDWVEDVKAAPLSERLR